VNRRRGLLLVVLVYVAFDFSLADMPGAFMFDADGSIESVEVVRGRAPAEVIVLAAPLGGSSPLAQRPRSDIGRRPPPGTAVARHWRPLVNRLPRATVASPRPSEDSH
jgi:hypothetical protein